MRWFPTPRPGLLLEGFRTQGSASLHPWATIRRRFAAQGRGWQYWGHGGPFLICEVLALASQGGDGTGCGFEAPDADFRLRLVDLFRPAFVNATWVGAIVGCRPLRARFRIGFVPRAHALGCSSFAASRLLSSGCWFSGSRPVTRPLLRRALRPTRAVLGGWRRRFWS